MVGLMDDIEDNGIKIWTPEEIAQHNPFGEDATYILVDHHQLNINQLTDEIAARVGESVQLVIIGVPELGKRWMYVCPPVDKKAVEACIDGHVPDPDYGLPPEVLQREE